MPGKNTPAPIQLIKLDDDEFYLSVRSDGEEGLIHLDEEIWIRWAKKQWQKRKGAYYNG